MEMNFSETEVWGFEHSMRGMRNAINSGNQSDSGICKGGDNGIGCDNCAFEGMCGHYYNYSYQIGKNDLKLAQSLIQSGSQHASFMKMIHVSVDICMPSYWWAESDACRFGENNRSAMHKLLNREEPITLKSFNICEEEVDWWSKMVNKIEARTWDTNYEKLRNMYLKGGGFKHKRAWNNAFYDWMKTLPYSKELIMYQEVSKNGVSNAAN